MATVALTRIRWPIAALGCVALAALLVDYFMTPLAAAGLMPPGPVHTLTGFWCAGCGTTRAMHALMHGQLKLALTMNPLAVIALPLLPVIVLFNRGHVPPGFEGVARTLCSPRVWAVVLVAYIVARNLPWPPFSWLAPGGWGR